MRHRCGGRAGKVELLTGIEGASTMMTAVMIVMAAVMMIHRVCRFWLRRANSCV
jgi:hypothetical protein